MIVSLLGMSRVGKDTVALSYIDKGFKRFAFGDALKERYSRNTGISMEEINGVNKERYRPDIIELSVIKRKDNPFYWVDQIKQQMIDLHTNGKHVILTDVRRIAEVQFIKMLKETFGNDVIKLYEVVKPKSNGGKFDMDTETTQGIAFAHFDNLIDGVIVNNGTITELDTIVESIISGYGE